jgi:outer membrane protein
MENNKFNKILLACNAVLLLGLVGIYILHFTGNNGGSKVNANAKAPVVKEGGLKIAYVDTDTLLANYQYAKDLEAELLTYKNQQEQYGKQQMEKFQKDYQDYLKNGSNMTLSQQQAKEAELKQRAERMATLEQELTAKIMERQITENTKLLKAIFAFVREYNEQNQQFDIILRKTFENSPTLYMDSCMDITKEILDGLNEEYKNVKGKKEE